MPGFAHHATPMTRHRLADVPASRLSIGIVGAGPAGLAAALFLARSGHDVEIVERFEKPAPLGSGLLMQPTGLD